MLGHLAACRHAKWFDDTAASSVKVIHFLKFMIFFLVSFIIKHSGELWKCIPKLVHVVTNSLGRVRQGPVPFVTMLCYSELTN